MYLVPCQKEFTRGVFLGTYPLKRKRIPSTLFLGHHSCLHSSLPPSRLPRSLTAPLTPHPTPCFCRWRRSQLKQGNNSLQPSPRMRGGIH